MKHIVIEQGEMYTLLKRDAKFCPYVVTFGYDSESSSWSNGHYFNDLKTAVDFLYSSDMKYKNWERDSMDRVMNELED